MTSRQLIRHQHERVMRGLQPALNVAACLVVPLVYTLRKSWPDILLACTVGMAGASALFNLGA